MSLLIRVSMLSLTHMEKRMRQVVIAFGDCRLHGGNVRGRESYVVSMHRVQSEIRCVNLNWAMGWAWVYTRGPHTGRKNYLSEMSRKNGRNGSVHIRHVASI